MTNILLLDSNLIPHEFTLKPKNEWFSDICWNRLSKLQHEIRRTHFILGRYLLYVVLDRMGRKHDVQRIFIDGNGKPHVPDLSFSISHSGCFIGIAYTDKEPSIGLDIELMQNRPFEPFAHFFQQNELSRIHASTDPLSCFYKYWTAKEAALKYHGLGIQHVKDFEVDPLQKLITNTRNQQQISFGFNILNDKKREAYACSWTYQTEDTMTIEQINL